jgi:hypothetical protein
MYAHEFLFVCLFVCLSDDMNEWLSVSVSVCEQNLSLVQIGDGLGSHALLPVREERRAVFRLAAAADLVQLASKGDAKGVQVVDVHTRVVVLAVDLLGLSWKNAHG